MVGIIHMLREAYWRGEPNKFVLYKRGLIGEGEELTERGPKRERTVCVERQSLLMLKKGLEPMLTFTLCGKQ